MSNIKAFGTTRTVGMEVVFQVVDQAAAGNCTVTASDKEKFSRLSDLVTGRETAPRKYATMEDGLVKTDGTWDIMQQSAFVPYWSKSISGPDGKFKNPPMLTFTLSAPATVVGFTMHFDPAALPKEITFTVQDKKSGYIITGGSYTVDSADFAVELPAANFDQVFLRFDSTAEPHRRIRMQSFVFGVSRGLTEEDFEKATIKSGCSPACTAIPSSQLDLVVDNSRGQYNMLNPTGFFQSLQQGQPIDTYISIDGQRVHTGRFYFTGVSASDDSLTAHITANDKVYTWDGEDYDKGVDSSVEFAKAIKEVLGSDYKYDIPADIANRLVSRNIKKDTSKRKAAQLMCQAARCTCWINREGVVVFRDLQGTGDPKEVFDAYNMPSMDCMAVRSLEHTAPVDQLILKYNGSIHRAGKGTNPYTVQAPAVIPATAQAVAEWLLSLYRLRVICDFNNRGNPELLTGDTITVYNSFGIPEQAVIYEQELIFDGGLEARTKAIGRPWAW